MIDQANDLRRLVMQAAERAPSTVDSSAPMVLVSGGKGGVGTTTVALNLAVLAAQRGIRTVLIDGDPDGADVQSLCRLRERYTISDVLAARRTLGEALQPGPAGVHVLPGAWAAADLADASESSQTRLLDQFAALGARADLVLIDGGNGRHGFTRRLWQACSDVVLVVTPETNAVLDGYAAMKVAVPAGRAGIHLLVNRCEDCSDAEDVHKRIARSCRRFLGLELAPCHWLPADATLASAGRQAAPFVVSHPESEAARRLAALAESLQDGLPPRRPEHPAPGRPESRLAHRRNSQKQLI